MTTDNDTGANIRRTAVLILAVLGFIAASLASLETGFQTDLAYAQVRAVRLTYRGDGRWRVDVTVRHADEGWNHYADVWEILDDENGTMLGERILAHPHETEQPFTRSLSAVDIPKATRRVRIRAGCNVHGFGGREITADVPGAPDIGTVIVGP